MMKKIIFFLIIFIFSINALYAHGVDVTADTMVIADDSNGVLVKEIADNNNINISVYKFTSDDEVNHQLEHMLNNSNKRILVTAYQDVANDFLKNHSEVSNRLIVLDDVNNDTIKDGLNTIIITVSDDNTDSNLYYIRVYKKHANYVYLKKMKEISALSSSIIVSNTIKDDHLLEQKYIELVANSNKQILYNVINDDGGLLYQITLDKQMENKEDIDATITKEKDAPLVYSSKIREGVKVLLYLDTEEFSDGEIIKIYSYNEEGNYVLVSNNTEIENGYVEFTTDGNKYYVFTKQVLIEEEDNTIKMLKQFKDYIIFGIGFVVLIIVLLIISKIKKKKKVVENK